MERRIEHVRDLLNGKEIVASEFFRGEEGFVFKRRYGSMANNLKEQPDLVCSVCNQPVHIAGTKEQEFYFKHFKEKGDCPIKTKGDLSQEQINRLRYAGVKESPLHLQLKDEVEAALLADSARCSNVMKEKIRRSSFDPNLWRKPDVSCDFHGRKLVFEVQLSTTYLNVITERETHYREDQTFVVWLFSYFDPNDLRFVEKDILYANHGHAFVFDAAAREQSAAAKKLVLHCYRLLNPAIGIAGGWGDSFIELGALTYDFREYRAYLTLPGRQQLATDFEAYWMTRAGLAAVDRIKRDGQFGDRFAEQGLEFGLYDLMRVFDALYSLKSGCIVGYSYPSYDNGLLRIAHAFYDNHTEFCRFFFWALKHYGKTDLVKAQDREKKLQKKVKSLREKKGDQKYMFPEKYLPVLRLLFPELPEIAFGLAEAVPTTAKI